MWVAARSWSCSYSPALRKPVGAKLNLPAAAPWNEAEIETVDEAAIATLHVVVAATRLNPFPTNDDLVAHQRLLPTSNFLPSAFAIAARAREHPLSSWRSSPGTRHQQGVKSS